jgi:hypothetical protein
VRVSTRELAEQHLRALAGEHAVLREDQWTAIDALVTGRRRALVVQRTGWGKSAVYFVATALLRAAARARPVIVSPLLALMRNQITRPPAGRHPRGHRQLQQRRRLAPGVRRGRAAARWTSCSSARSA